MECKEKIQWKTKVASISELKGRNLFSKYSKALAKMQTYGNGFSMKKFYVHVV